LRLIFLNLEHLRSFIVVAREGNLSAAAKYLGTIQLNLGRQMTALSKEVGMDLFVRHSRGVSLTAEGQEFLQLCQQTIGRLDQGAALIRERKLNPPGYIKSCYWNRSNGSYIRTSSFVFTNTLNLILNSSLLQMCFNFRLVMQMWGWFR